MDPLDQTAFLKNLDHMGELLLCDTQLVRQLRHGIVLICPAVERDQGEKWKRVDFHIMAWLVVAFRQGEKAECKLQEVDTGVF